MDRQSVTAGRDVTEDAFLGGRVRLRQPSRGYRAGVDAVLLAASVQAANRSLKVLDAGAGVGTVGLCVASRLADASVVLVEHEPTLARLAAENIALNAVEDRVTLIEGDLTARASTLESLGLVPHSFDAVLANPPYHDRMSGTPARDTARAGAHAMASGDLQHWAKFLSHMARSGGTVAMIHKAEAIQEVLSALSPRFGALQVLPIFPRPEAAAIRIIVTGVRGSRAPLTLLAPFVLHGAEGNGFTPQAAAVLRDGAHLAPFAK